MSGEYNPYTIQQLFKAAFGLNDPIYRIEGSSQSPYSPDYSGIKTVKKEKTKMSWLGTPILFPIRFNAGNYWEYSQQGYLKDERTEVSEWFLPATTLVDFNRPKNIVRTEVLGGNGTVKEIYGFDDWQIRMRGIALDEPQKTAAKQIEDLLRFEKIADSISVEAGDGFNELFAQKSIERIVIQEVDIKQVQAKPGMIPFEIKAISDEPWEFFITDKKKRRGTVEFGELKVIGVIADT